MMTASTVQPPRLTEPDDQYGGACQLSHRVVLPPARLPVVEQPRQALRESEQAEDRELGERTCVHPCGANR